MWMPKWWRAYKAEIAEANAIKKFAAYAQESVEHQREIKDRIVAEKSNLGSWDEAILDPEISRLTYELFLHCQFMGSLAEDVRMAQFKARELRSQETRSIWRVGEDLGDVGANCAQRDIYKEYLAGLEMEVNAIEGEMLPQTRSKAEMESGAFIETESITFTELDEKTILRADGLQKYEKRVQYLVLDVIDAEVRVDIELAGAKEDADIMDCSVASDFETRQRTVIAISGTCSYGMYFDKLRFIDPSHQTESGKLQSERMRVFKFTVASYERKSAWVEPVRDSELFAGFGLNENPNISLAAPLPILESMAEALRKSPSAQFSIGVATDAYCSTSYGDDTDCVVSPQCAIALLWFRMKEQYSRKTEEAE